MNMEKFTKKSIEALQDTQSLALQNGNQQLEQVHLLSALVSKSDGLIPSLITRAGASAQTVSELCEGIISSPRWRDSGATDFIFPASLRAFSLNPKRRQRK